MATLTQIVSVEEYLNASYRPDREYLSGEVRERNVGKWEHARLQFLLEQWFANHESEWNVMGSTEQRLRIREDRVRVPNLVVVRPARNPISWSTLRFWLLKYSRPETPTPKLRSGQTTIAPSASRPSGSSTRKPAPQECAPAMPGPKHGV
jgi:hypothetical protein